jgi:hypothetical protein
MVGSEKAAGNHFRLRVPTSVVVTLLGAALTVWLAPAFTRQWDDRQAARDLKAGLAEHGVISAFQTIQVGARLAEGRGGYDVILARWREAALKTEVNAKAYFGRSVLDEWQEAGQYVEYFLLASDYVADVRVEAGYRRADDRSDPQYKYERISKQLELLAPAREDAFAAAQLLASDKASDRARGMEQVKTWPLAKIETAADKLLSAHPSGFSTTRGDLLNDLLP